MAYRDEYYNRTPEQEYKIYQERERSWNVLRFGVLIFPFLGVLALFNHWARLIVEPAVQNVTAAPSQQAVVVFDESCLYVPFLMGALLIGALMLRAIARSNQDVRESRPGLTQSAEQPQSEAVPPVQPKRTVSAPESSTLADDYIKEMEARKERQRAKASLLAMARAQKREAEERVREAQSARLIATAEHDLRTSTEDRIALEKLKDELYKQNPWEIT